MIHKFTSVKQLIAKVYRDLKIQEEDRWVDMIEWSAEALELIGTFQQYHPKTVDLTVEGNRAKLPCDFYKVIQIAYGNIPIQYGTGSFDNTYHCDDCINLKTKSQFVYTINNSYIFTNFDGAICLSYLAIPVDEEGFPMIPDDASYMEALYKYIDMKLLYPEFRAGRIPQGIYNEAVHDWNYKCMQARGAGNMPNIDKMEAIKGQWLRLIPDINQHSVFFNSLGQQERINIGR